MKVRELEVTYGKTVTEVDGRQMSSPSHVARVAREFIGDAPEERFIVLFLDSRHRVRNVQEISRGTINASLVHPREVFRAAILENCAAIIVAHNHPSGDSFPSREDNAVTERLVKAGKVIGIEVLDHIIVGDDVYSYKSEGKM